MSLRSRFSDEERTAFLGSGSPDSGSSDDFVDEVLLKNNDNHDRLPHRLTAWLLSRPRVLRRSFRRHPLHFLVLTAKYVAVFFAVLFVLTPIFLPSYTRLPPHYRQLQERCSAPDATAGCANPLNEKVFLSVSLYDKGGHLAGGRWGETILELIQMLGPENTFLSIYENDSPSGQEALEEFKKAVPCKHEIVYDAHVSLSAFPNITLPDGSQSMKRLAYLSEMRNRALRPLDKFQQDVGVVQYDKVLFLNDIAFNPVDAAQLVFSTNQGPDGRSRYLSVCSLDYNESPLLFYDLYAQRDAEGYSNGVPLFPYFSGAGHAYSRSDMLAQKDAVRVKSCWAGMVAMQAKYVQNLTPSLPYPGFEEIGTHVIDPVHPEPVQAPIRFRYEPGVFIDACECCLFLADISTAAANDGATHQGVFVNPYVRVAYDEKTLSWLPVVRRWERLFEIPQRIGTYFAGLPRNNPYREVKEGQSFTEEVWNPDAEGSGKGAWEMVDRTGRNGLFCAVREMQVLRKSERVGDKNWRNVKMPPGQRLEFPT